MNEHTSNSDRLAQTPEPPLLTLQTGNYVSQALGCERPYAFFLPAPADEPTATAETRYPLLVLLHGRNGDFQSWPTHTRIARYAARYALAIAFPDGENGWYTNAADGSRRYEDDLIQDFLLHLQATLPLLPPGSAWGIGGLSMGGYGAVKIALKYPELFSVAVSHSGAFETVMVPKPHPIFGAPQADAAFRHRENPVWLAEQALCRWPIRRPQLYLDCGLDDELLEVNRRFSGHLNFLGYPHRYHEQPGYHTWPYWDRAFRTVLPTIARELGATANTP